MTATSSESSGLTSDPLSASSSSWPHRPPPHYCCVECLTPTPSLYKQYSTPSSVKLTRCSNCSHDVDPFVERESLLVSFDIVLHRLAAYRHVLFNRELFADFELAGGGAASVRRALKFSIGGSILDAYIKYEAFRYREFVEHRHADGGPSLPSAPDEGPSVFLDLMAISFLEQMLLLIGTIIAVFPILDADTKSYFVSRLSLGTMLPCIFKAIVIFVHIWENSPTVRIVGSAFVASIQWMSVHTIVERVLVMSSERRQSAEGESMSSSLRSTSTWQVYESIPGIPLLVGMLLRSTVPILLALLLFRDGRPLNQCSGLDMQISLWLLDTKMCLT